MLFFLKKISIPNIFFKINLNVLLATLFFILWNIIYFYIQLNNQYSNFFFSYVTIHNLLEQEMLFFILFFPCHV
jgi:hypothetical protein